MDENNNNHQTPVYDEAEEMTIPPVKNLDPKLLVAVVVIILLAVGIVMTMLSKTQTSDPMPTVVPTVPEVVVPAPVVDTNPPKVSAGEALPEGFPTSLLLEEQVKISEGYSLAYTEANKNQLTTNFLSNKSMVANYEAYESFFTANQWTITNRYQSDSLSALYAKKLNEEVNVTFQTTGTTTAVSISLLKN